MRAALGLPDARSAALALLLTVPPAGAPARALQFELGADLVGAAQLGDARVRARDQRAALAWHAAGIGARLDYGYRRFEHLRVEGRDRDNLHRLALDLRWLPSSGAPRPALSLRPVIATSSNVMKDFIARGSSDDWMLHGAASLAGDAGARASWEVGIARDDVLGRLRAYPVASVTVASGALRAALGWPVTRVEWNTGSALRVGAGVAPAGGRWHVVSDARDGAEFRYQLRAWRAGLDARWRIGPRWSLAAQAGVEFDRHFGFESDLGARIDARAGDARFASIGVVYGR